MNNTWIKASEKMPERNGEYLVVIIDSTGKYVELCDYNKKFSCWDFYHDRRILYNQNDVAYWMKIPEYKNLEK